MIECALQRVVRQVQLFKRGQFREVLQVPEIASADDQGFEVLVAHEVGSGGKGEYSEDDIGDDDGIGFLYVGVLVF